MGVETPGGLFGKASRGDFVEGGGGRVKELYEGRDGAYDEK